MGNIDLGFTLRLLPGIIIGLTVHEYSHALVAHMCGDSTSKEMGRITLNPLKHIDPLGFILLIFAGFGWAKPVQFNEENLRNPKRDVIKIALAGPISNAVVAMLLSIILSVLSKYIPIYHSSGMQLVIDLFKYAININWVLFIFNLIPLPPLDGSHVLLNQFKKFPALYTALYKYGSWLLFGLIVLTFITKINLFPILPVIQFLSDGFLSIVGYR